MKQDNDNKEEKAGNNLPPIIFNTQYIKDFSLEIPHAPEIFKNIKSAPDVKIDVDVNVRQLENNVFNVDLNFSINGDSENEKFFILELTYSGVVTLNVPQEHVEPVLLIEVPRMLFPFARAVISHSLSEAGLPAFMINPIDFVSMYNNRKAK